MVAINESPDPITVYAYKRTVRPEHVSWIPPRDRGREIGSFYESQVFENGLGFIVTGDRNAGVETMTPRLQEFLQSVGDKPVYFVQLGYPLQNLVDGQKRNGLHGYAAMLLDSDNNRVKEAIGAVKCVRT